MITLRVTIQLRLSVHKHIVGIFLSFNCTDHSIVDGINDPGNARLSAHTPRRSTVEPLQRIVLISMSRRYLNEQSTKPDQCNGALLISSAFVFDNTLPIFEIKFSRAWHVVCEGNTSIM